MIGPTITEGAAVKKQVFIICCLIVFLAGSPLLADTPSIKDKVAGMAEYEGFFPFYWDGETGKIWLEIDKLDHEFLYVNSLAAGVGSNALGWTAASWERRV